MSTSRKRRQQGRCQLSTACIHPKNPPDATQRGGGHFESWEQLIAVGFDPASEEVENLNKEYKSGGIFVLSGEEEKLINSSMKNLNCARKVKFRHMLAHLMGLRYDLCLTPGDTVSTNPGFESILGVVVS